ncbi:probable ATP-dependent RNA helicase DDX52 [Orussus abietinus]|uniref:probable ATP-dependent RNA helicase DDX52 n=1 Tax=Orussus abietinus TaxID=222816 RepID=UPI0006262838|nr:probable ATP-dependent RNA helicase DDX52 [Orussus abietinus]XP_012272895.1 probable ATP-dependent RNA helicase DDX52 [Orussus abietinus]
MDAYDIFKKLTVGVKFDLKRFRRDAERFQLIKKPAVKDVNVNMGNTDLDDQNLSIKRKRDDDEEKKEDEHKENTQTLTLVNGISVPTDGSKIKRKKQKTLTEDKNLKLEQEKINHLRNQHHISAIGSHIPPPIQSFDELKDYQVADDLLDNMKNHGYTQPTPIQMQAMPIMLQGRQILGCAPTGSGKTAAFLLPIIHQLAGPQKKGFRAIIVNPTRELAKQTYRECMRLSEGRDFRVHIISKINQALAKYGPNSSKKYDILITTPNRLVFLLNQDPPAISLSSVEWLIVDEADKLFEEGTRGFRDQLDEISRACTNSNLRRAMFSATNTPAVTKWCRHNLKGLITVTIGQRNAAAELVEQELLFVGNEGGKLIAFRNIIQKGMTPPVLVFVQSKERAQELFNELIYDGINVDVIHADRTQTQRDNVVRCFREGKIWVLICTELMSRGIDFKGVNLVINYDFPTSAISYVHRIGRTGRAGHRGKAITFFTQYDTVNLRSIAAVMKASGCEVPEYMLAMKKHSKKVKRKLEREAPKRESISTIPIYEKQRKERRMKRLEGNMKSKETKDNSTAATESSVDNNKHEIIRVRKGNDNSTSNGRFLVKSKKHFNKFKGDTDVKKISSGSNKMHGNVVKKKKRLIKVNS